MGVQELSGKEFFQWRKKLLSKGGREVDFDWLIDICGGLRWSTLQKLHLDPSRSLKLQQTLEHLGSLWREHLDSQIPLQHLAGCCPWRDFVLEVSPEALIPRQETELLIDLALKRFDKDFQGLWADLGTGSGALAVALGRSLPLASGHAVDISEEALSLAQRNLQCLAATANVRLHLGSWWEPLTPWWGAIDLVLANPPYIPTAVINTLDPIVKENEPYLALCGGDDGLDPCREILKGACDALSNGGWLILEHQHDQSEFVLELMCNSGLKDVDFETDLQGEKRFAFGRCP